MKIFTLILLFVLPIVSNAQYEEKKATKSYTADVSQYLTIDVNSSEIIRSKPGGTEVLIRYFADTDSYIVDWMEDTTTLMFDLKFNKKDEKGKLYIVESANMRYYVLDEIASHKRFTITDAGGFEYEGKKLAFRYVIENVK